jgi:multisubunit Na+/H+ antiporter MnhG subunit
MTPFYGRLPDVAGFGVERRVDLIGGAVAVGVTAGIAAHAVATGIHRRGQRRELPVIQESDTQKATEGDSNG